MSFLPRLITFAVIIAASFAAYTITYNNPVSFNPSYTTVSTGSNGYRVALYQAGWVYGDPIQVSSFDTVTTYATLLQATGQVGIGLVGATCSNPYNTASGNTLTSPNNLNTNANICPADFATVYTGTRPASSTSGAALAASTLAVNTPVAWIITQPATTADNQVIGVEVQNWNEATAGSTSSIVARPSTAGDRDGSATAQNYAISTLEYSLYVQTTGTAIVCVQNYAQFTNSPGECGESYQVVGHSASSAGIISTSACIFVALIAFIFYN